MNTYPHEYESSLQQPDAFWLKQAQRLHWFSEPKQGLQRKQNGTADWFVDGELNIAFCALDYHVDNGRGEQIALIYDSPVTQTKEAYTYRELRDQVAHFAGLLKKHHVKKGDRVVIYMPMIPQAAIAMLACARLGAVHSVVFGGFAPHELAIRIDDAKPKVVITASCGVEVDKVIPYKPYVDEAIGLASAPPQQVIVWQREICQAELQSPRDVDWQRALAEVTPAECAVMKATDPLYILYTSGTTGKPKGVVRDTGGYAVALRYSMATVYGVEPGQVMFTASDVGWVVGHSYIVYGPLLAVLRPFCTRVSQYERRMLARSGGSVKSTVSVCYFLRQRRFVQSRKKIQKPGFYNSIRWLSCSVFTWRASGWIRQPCNGLRK